MQVRTMLCAASVVLLTLSAQSRATTIISYVGADLDEGAAWRTTTDVKPLDGDRDNVYGTDGWVAWTQFASNPSYGTIYGTMQSQASTPDYAQIDNALASGTTIQSGTSSSSSESRYFPGSGQYDAMAFTFEKQDVSSKTIRFGVMTDNLDNAIYNAATLTLRSRDTGVSATVTLDATKGYNKIPDWYFFDITGAVSTDAFYLVGTPGSGGLVTVGGNSFDAVVPEPSAIVLLIAGLVGLLAYAWRKRG